MQGTLFDLGAPPAAAAPVWERIGGSGTCGAVHVHLPSGMRVEHCGHPTANYPYTIECPNGEQIIDSNGRGFAHLVVAKIEVERLWRIASAGPPTYRILKNAGRWLQWSRRASWATRRQ